MPAKLSFMCLVNSVTEKDSANYIIREGTAIVRTEDNKSLDLRITSFVPKTSLALRWVPIFTHGSVLRFTGKFYLEETPS